MAVRPTATLEGEILDIEDPMMEAARSLGELAPANPNLTVQQERNLFGDIVTAQPIKVRRDEADILRRIDIKAMAAGTRYFYRYPVQNRKKRRTDYIEGPSVKCTNTVIRLYGNAAVESRTLPLRDGSFICYSRFADHETGFSMTKGQLVPKSATLGGEDAERRLQIAHNIGQSKSQRNVIEAALDEFVNRAWKTAKKSLIDRIGRDIEKSRKTIVAELGKLGIADIVPRVERLYARKAADWMAPDIAQIYAELQGILDGMSSVDETWPTEPPPEPRRDDPELPAAAGADSPGEHGGPPAAQQGPLPPASEAEATKGAPAAGGPSAAEPKR